MASETERKSERWIRYLWWIAWLLFLAFVVIALAYEL